MVKLHLLESHLIGIGHVAVRAATLDVMVEATAEILARWRIVPMLKSKIRNLPTREKLEFIKETFAAAIPTSKHAIAEFTSDVHAALNERNDIIHRIWEGSDDPNVKILAEIRDWMPSKAPKRVTDKTLMALAMRMIDLVWELQDWRDLVSQIRMRQPYASHGTLPPLPPLPSPPRSSHKDATDRGRRRDHQPDSSQC
jgi:hypothetical protein